MLGGGAERELAETRLGHHELPAVAHHLVVDAELQRLEQRALAVEAAAHDERDPLL